MQKDSKQLVQYKIRQLVYFHAVYVKSSVGFEIDQEKEYRRLYADWQADLITLENIESDIKEYYDLLHPAA